MRRNKYDIPEINGEKLKYILEDVGEILANHKCTNLEVLCINLYIASKALMDSEEDVETAVKVAETYITSFYKSVENYAEKSHESI